MKALELAQLSHWVEQYEAVVGGTGSSIHIVVEMARALDARSLWQRSTTTLA